VETPQVPVVPEPEPVDTVDHTTLASADSSAQAGNGAQESRARFGQAGRRGKRARGRAGNRPGKWGGQWRLGERAAPRLRQFILVPENTPRELRGQTITINFSIRANGRVEQVEFSPEIRNRDLRQQIPRTAPRLHFRPAKSAAGVPIAAEYPISVTF
jgi:hypothetical protein